MKKLIILLTLLFVFSESQIAQSTSIELVPELTLMDSEYVSVDLELDIDFTDLSFVGMSCFHFDKKGIQLSYRIKQNGQWSEWINYYDQHEFQSETKSALESQPIFKAFESIQFKSDSPLQSEITFRLFLAQKSKVDLPTPSKSLNCELPEICDRSCWCPTCPIDPTPTYTEPTHIIVHHSAGFTTSNDFAAVVEYYYDLHTNTNGWDDIGYNWLIDANGIIYQGRPDGYQGAHFSCINENTVGICVIGDFTNTLPTIEAQDMLAELIGHEATEHEIDVTAESYHLTGDFILDNIAGHRDSSGSIHACSTTACPGNTFYPMLENVRTAVSELPCYINTISGQQEIEAFEVDIFPNPFVDILFVNGKKDELTDLQLIDLNGKVISSLNINEDNYLTDIVDGLYFVVSNGKILSKVVKQ